MQSICKCTNAHMEKITHTHLRKDQQLGERWSSSFAQNQTILALSEFGWLYQLAFVISSFSHLLLGVDFCVCVFVGDCI